MGYKFESISIDDVKTRLQNYDYALLYSISEKKLIPANQVTEADLDECMDARFFSSRGELHLFSENDVLKCVCLSDDDVNTEDESVRVLPLENRFDELNGKIGEKTYLAYDEDGQVHVKMTRLMVMKIEAEEIV